jgi:hypothetical protein
MRRKKHTHLRGERGQAFADRIRGILLEQILCVSLDIHKYFHVVMIHNALGEIVTMTFEIDIFQAGFDRLCQAIDEAVARTNAQVVLVGMEPTGHYFENLARHLHQRPQPVTLVNSFAVSRNREQQMMRREKDDEIDVAAIGDLLRRGEGTSFQPAFFFHRQEGETLHEGMGEPAGAGALGHAVLVIHSYTEQTQPGQVLPIRRDSNDKAASLQRRGCSLLASDRYSRLRKSSYWACEPIQNQ